jgi:hypothetical protein
VQKGFADKPIFRSIAILSKLVIALKRGLLLAHHKKIISSKGNPLMGISCPSRNPHSGTLIV